MLARVYGVADPAEVGDSAYVDGFLAATSAALDYALATLAQSRHRTPPVPPALVAQARLAARNGVGLDTVLRRYTAGHALLLDFIVEEVERDKALGPGALRGLLAFVSAAFDRLLAVVGDEHACEVANCSRFSANRRRVELVERLIAGEPVDSRELAYDLSGWHLGLVLKGGGGRPALTDLARALDRQLLAVEPDPHLLWAWLGGERRIEAAEVLDSARACLEEVRVALGEPARGLAGWRLSHEQAKSVLPFATGDGVAVVRYAERGLLASVCRDRVLVESLRGLYLDPLCDGSDGDEDLCDTLRAYFAAGCNITSAASSLALHRQTVGTRLRTAEERLGMPLARCAAELTLALMLPDSPQPLDP